MIIGPQFISAVFFATSTKPVKNSIAFVGAVAVAVGVGTLISIALAKLLGVSDSGSEQSTASDVLPYLLSAALVVLSARTYLKRGEIELPSWIASLQEADTRLAFRLGMSLIFLMPTDLIVMLGVGEYLVSNGLGWVDAIPFILATALIAGLPLIALLLLGDRAETAIPRARDWMNSNAWVIQIVVYLFFIYLLLG